MNNLVASENLITSLSHDELWELFKDNRKAIRNTDSLEHAKKVLAQNELISDLLGKPQN